MGMFDNVRIAYPIEPSWLQDKWFQTKDFESIGDTYRIDEGGTLWIETYDLEFNEEAVGLQGMFKRIYKEPTKMYYFSGKLNFYHYETSNHLMYDYTATFVDGKLTELERKEY